MVKIAYPREFHVTVDTREQLPVLFPRVLDWWPERRVCKRLRIKVACEVIHTGDYLPTHWPDLVAIERKGSLSELHTNLVTRDYRRFTAALDKLAEVKHPYLLCDFSISQTVKPSLYCPNPDMVVDALCRECTKRGINILWFGPSKTSVARYRLGAFLLRLMIGHVSNA